MTSWQAARAELEYGNLTPLVIRALLKCAVADIPDVPDVPDILLETPRTFVFATSAIVQAAQETNLDLQWYFVPVEIPARRVGQILRKLRLTPVRSEKARGWRVTVAELRGLCVGYGIPWPAKWELSAGPSLAGDSGKEGETDDNPGNGSLVENVRDVRNVRTSAETLGANSIDVTDVRNVRNVRTSAETLGASSIDVINVRNVRNVRTSAETLGADCMPDLTPNFCAKLTG